MVKIFFLEINILRAIYTNLFVTVIIITADNDILHLSEERERKREFI